jgi:uncharacterized membrane protein YhaH (DUF805 family)
LLHKERPMEWMLLPYRRYAEFTGRSRRKEFWLFHLFLFLVGVVITAIFGPDPKDQNNAEVFS